MEKTELIITALQQRIGELTANYETQIAILRAELTMFAQQEEDRKKAVDEYQKELLDKVSSN